MNKIYKVIKNRQGKCLAVSELAKGRGKKAKSLLIKTAVVGAISTFIAGGALAAIIPIESDETIKGDGSGTIQGGVSNDQHFVGMDGIGSLTISDQGSLTTQRIMVGKNEGSSGKLILDNGHLTSTVGSVYLGGGGDADILITNGGTFTNTGWASTSVAYDSSSNAKVTISGNGSVLSQRHDISIANDGNAVINILDRGVVNSSRGTFIGNEDGNAIINIDGQGSAFNSTGLRLGTQNTNKKGYGEINITNGGSLNVEDGDAYKELIVRHGKILVDGEGSQLNATKKVKVFNHTKTDLTSEITVSNNATMKVKDDANGDNEGILIEKGGAVNIGGAVGKAAEKAGTIDTPIITLKDDGELNFNHTDKDYQVLWDIDGEGNVNVVSGDNFVNGKHTYKGKTNITGGSLNANGENVFSPNSDYNIGKGGSLNLNNHNQTVGNVVNAGTIDLGKNSANTVLTVNGDYHGENGQLNIYADVAKKQSDKMVVTGNATGKTNINIVEINGKNIEEGEIIDFVEVNGDDESEWHVIEKPDSALDYVFDWDAYGRLLIKYTNAFSNVHKSPVAGSVFANHMASLNMFRHSAHDRDTSIYVPESNVWMSYKYNRAQSDLFGGKQSVNIRTSVIEMGVDVLSQEQFKVGVYGGYGHSSTDTNQKHSVRKGDGRVTGYNLGVYGNWNDQVNGAGLYVDTWAQYSWFKNNNSTYLSEIRHFSSHYNGKAITVSAEAGYGLVLHEGLVKNWLLEPHAQLGYTWSDSHNFKLGTQGEVSNVNGDGVQMRLGARFYGQSTKEGYGVLPFIEANWLYDSSSPEAKINGKHVESDMSKNYIELKVGVNGNLTKSLSSYAQLDSRFGSNNYRQLGAQIGLNYSF
ncbi:hypothetical protein A9G48_10545 [Gilliamella sp. wkB18]|uniref:autotransporter outer membrane beta-barrel domain-containing protein n=1 Tax=Gilliamella sp. wkB18 TaxID=3120260 RepID=UPI0004DD7AC3|nr:autotransporter outer membrane beta-barrel domain-containing protein [Gilliamella apicola]KFA58575.1 putative autotransporter protein [Gilliamella apicola]OCG65728.1 hypothetical protein A9G48_10545 [Gilliamella apicola]